MISKLYNIITHIEYNISNTIYIYIFKLYYMILYTIVCLYLALLPFLGFPFSVDHTAKSLFHELISLALRVDSRGGAPDPFHR